MNDARKRVTIREVGPRDGLQKLSRVMPSDEKRHWIKLAHAAGVRHMELVSFGGPTLIAQLADGLEMVSFAQTLPDLVISASVSSAEGAREALTAGVHRLCVPISASVLHSLSNVRRTPREMIEELRAIREVIDGWGKHAAIELVAVVATALGCSYRGTVPNEDVCDRVLQAVDAGCDSLALADTTGQATPDKVEALIEAVLPFSSGNLRSAHFHNTYGLGLANVATALECGILEFDASLAGLGADDATGSGTGNVVTEDLTFMLESMGYSTGIDLRLLLECRSVLSRVFTEDVLDGFVARSKLPDAFQQTP
jgi:hydroxymethylglutaryl-CoA lyase